MQIDHCSLENLKIVKIDFWATSTGYHAWNTFSLDRKWILIDLLIISVKKYEKIKIFQLNPSPNSEIFKFEVQNGTDLRAIFFHREFQTQPITFKIVLK